MRHSMSASMRQLSGKETNHGTLAATRFSLPSRSVGTPSYAQMLASSLKGKHCQRWLHFTTENKWQYTGTILVPPLHIVAS